MKLSTAIKKYPNGMIYYHDNQAWVYYKRCLTQEELDGKSVPLSLEVANGEDWGNFGYAPNIVVELARLLKIKVESV
jgi:hypothetical protein